MQKKQSSNFIFLQLFWPIAILCGLALRCGNFFGKHAAWQNLFKSSGRDSMCCVGSKQQKMIGVLRFTLLGANISAPNGTFEDNCPIPKVGYVSSPVFYDFFEPPPPNSDILQGFRAAMPDQWIPMRTLPPNKKPSTLLCSTQPKQPIPGARGK